MKNRIRFLRAEKGWTQKALANRLGIAPMMISLFEHWRRDPTLALAYRFADAFEKRIDEVFPHEPETLPPEEPEATAFERELSSIEAARPRQNQVRALRVTKRWSQRELAERVGVSQCTMNAIERSSRKPSLALAYAISQVLGASVLEIFPPDAFTKLMPPAASSEETP